MTINIHYGSDNAKPYQPFSMDAVLKQVDEMMDQYWHDYPDLYQSVQTEKQRSVKLEDPKTFVEKISPEPIALQITAKPSPLFDTALRGPELRKLLYENHCIRREQVLATGSAIIPRTQASNRKSPHASLKDEQAEREELLAAQIQLWRSMFPSLLAQFSKLPDYRNPTRIDHKITVLMMFGLLAFIFRLQSRREMNRELTGPVIFEHLKRLFPEIDSIPHADTLARLLEHLDPKRIEGIHIGLIREMIRKKKFRKILVAGCIPVTIDGAQKLYRQGLRQDERWLERTVGKAETKHKQQYVYVLEANLTFKNGLTIPLMSECLYREHNKLEETETKQDNEVTAAERLLKRLKKYFPRQKFFLFADGIFATQTIMDIIDKNNWEYMIRLPKEKLTDFAKILQAEKEKRVMLIEQPYYRERLQSFFWKNNITYGYDYQLRINLIACFEEYEIVNPETAEIEKHFSEHAWISSVPASVANVHELTNLGARKSWLIEHSFNVEKHQGYHYKHAFSYEWHAMQGFHYLMRLGHAINAISEFSKTIKTFVKERGCAATLKIIKDTLSAPWLALHWYSQQRSNLPEIRLQLE